jgi:hypothetical protein
MEYGYAFKDKGSGRTVILNHHGKSEEYRLEFSPRESIMLEISPKGIKRIDLGYIPPKMAGL